MSFSFAKLFIIMYFKNFIFLIHHPFTSLFFQHLRLHFLYRFKDQQIFINLTSFKSFLFYHALILALTKYREYRIQQK